MVIDANIWISSIVSGKLGELEMLPYTYDIELLVCKDMTDEIENALRRPKFAKYLVLAPGEYIASIKRQTTSVRIRHEFTGCRDTRDNYLFDLAMQGNAKYLVSGDKDVVEMPPVKGLNVVKLTEFLRVLRQELN